MKNIPANPENEPGIEITLLTDDGLEALERAIPARGAHPVRLQEQKDGKSSYLIAYQNGTPVGHLNLKWNGDESETIKEHVQNCPEINGLSVWPPEMQSQGIGRKLVIKAEEMAKERGFKQIGLGVGLDNPRAKALYERLGYVDWGHGTYVDSWTDRSTGEAHADPCYYLIKPL